MLRSLFLAILLVCNGLQSLANEIVAVATKDRTFALAGESRHTLWIPKDYQHRDKHVDVLFDFHGATQLVRKNSQLAGLNCVVINVQYAGLSSVYRVPFSEDRQLFGNILSAALTKLRQQPDFPEEVEWGKLSISSFSAGFGGVREVLKTPSYFDRIDGLYLVDSLYCGYVGDGTDQLQQGVVHPGLMKDFLRFAQQAAVGKKVMIVTHCRQPTPGYASTLETADYLLDKLKLEPQPIELIVNPSETTGKNTQSLKIYRQAKRKGFSLYGSTGRDGTDHVLHLRHMDHWLPGLPLAKRTQSAK